MVEALQEDAPASAPPEEKQSTYREIKTEILNSKTGVGKCCDAPTKGCCDKLAELVALVKAGANKGELLKKSREVVKELGLNENQKKTFSKLLMEDGLKDLSPILIKLQEAHPELRSKINKETASSAAQIKEQQGTQHTEPKSPLSAPVPTNAPPAETAKKIAASEERSSKDAAPAPSREIPSTTDKHPESHSATKSQTVAKNEEVSTKILNETPSLTDQSSRGATPEKSILSKQTVRESSSVQLKEPSTMKAVSSTHQTSEQRHVLFDTTTQTLKNEIETRVSVQRVQPEVSMKVEQEKSVSNREGGRHSSAAEVSNLTQKSEHTNKQVSSGPVENLSRVETRVTVEQVRPREIKLEWQSVLRERMQAHSVESVGSKKTAVHETLLKVEALPSSTRVHGNFQRHSESAQAVQMQPSRSRESRESVSQPKQRTNHETKLETRTSQVPKPAATQLTRSHPEQSSHSRLVLNTKRGPSVGQENLSTRAVNQGVRPIPKQTNLRVGQQNQRLQRREVLLNAKSEIGNRTTLAASRPREAGRVEQLRIKSKDAIAKLKESAKALLSRFQSKIAIDTPPHRNVKIKNSVTINAEQKFVKKQTLTPLEHRAQTIEKNLSRIENFQTLKRNLSPEVTVKLNGLRNELRAQLKNLGQDQTSLHALLHEIRTLLAGSQTRRLRLRKKGSNSAYSDVIQSSSTSESSLKKDDELGFGLQVEQDVEIQAEEAVEETESSSQEMMLVSNSDGPKGELDVYQALFDDDHVKRKRRLEEPEFSSSDRPSAAAAA